MIGAPKRPALVLVATPIGNLGDLTLRAIRELSTVDLIACEDTRRTGRLLELGVAPAVGEGYERPKLMSVHVHNEEAGAQRICELIASGSRVAYVSDAGTPGVSDPGQRIAAACIAAGLDVEVVPGASAVLAALLLSGFDTERFCFEGFLPRKGSDRKSRLQELSAERRTAVLYESPNRVGALLSDLASVCGDERQACVCRELTKMHEEVVRSSLGELRMQYAEADVIGEIVVVLSGNSSPIAEASDDELNGALQERIAGGATQKDAIATVMETFGVAKNRVYELALALKAK